jgi:hypothetical protein
MTIRFEDTEIKKKAGSEGPDSFPASPHPPALIPVFDPSNILNVEHLFQFGKPAKSRQIPPNPAKSATSFPNLLSR